MTLAEAVPFSPCAVTTCEPSVICPVAQSKPMAVASAAGISNVASRWVSMPAESPMVCHSPSSVLVLVFSLLGAMLTGR